MAARRPIEPTGSYHGPVWGSVSRDYPTEQAERVYRYLLDQMPADSTHRALMGYGFTGVAYRFRATTEYQAEFETSFLTPGGAAPPVDDHYRQERALFGFFVSGLACLESFAFAVHAIGAHFSPGIFGLSPGHLKAVEPKAVTECLRRVWPSALITAAMSELVQDNAYRKWKDIRNVLGHRAVPPRLMEINLESGVRTTWQLVKVKYQFLDNDEPLDAVVGPRRHWLEKHIRNLWNGVEQSFPPQ